MKRANQFGKKVSLLNYGLCWIVKARDEPRQQRKRKTSMDTGFVTDQCRQTGFKLGFNA